MFFFFNDTATTEIYTLSLHDALPICGNVEPNMGRPLFDSAFVASSCTTSQCSARRPPSMRRMSTTIRVGRSEEHTSELQSQSNLVCRLLLEKKKYKIYVR